MPGKTRRSKKNKRTKKTKKRRYGGAPALSSKKSSAKLSAKSSEKARSSEKSASEKLKQLIQKKNEIYARAAVGNIQVVEAAINMYEYASNHPELLNIKAVQGMLTMILANDMKDIRAERIKTDDKPTARDFINAYKRLNDLLAEAKRNA